MARRRDEKLHKLGTLLGEGWSSQDLTRLSRLGDFTEVAPGVTLQNQGHTTRWCYWVVGGSAVVTRDGAPVAMCGPGSLLPGGAVGSTRIAPASVVALGDLEVMAVGVREFLGAVDIVPALDRAFSAAS